MKFDFPATVVIEAPAERVWHVIAHEFADIGQWATAVQERFTYFDEEGMRFGYMAVAGLPRFIRHAENNWSVQPLSTKRAQVEIRGELELSDRWAWLMAPILKWQLSRTGKFTIEELKYYIEEGKPHPRKVRAQQR